MADVKRRIERIKNTHYIVSAGLFIASLCFCSYTAQDLKLINISLSHFGIYNKIGLIWNSSVFLIGVTLLIEAYLNTKKYLSGASHWLFYFFCFSILCLLLTAVISMSHRIHFYTAYIYFIGFTLSMFLFGYLLIKTDFRIGITSIVISVISVLFPVAIVMYLHSFAIPELTHTSLVFTWVIITRFDSSYKNFLKRFGL